MTEMRTVSVVSLGSSPRIAVLTADYKGLLIIVKIKSMLLLFVRTCESTKVHLHSICCNWKPCENSKNRHSSFKMVYMNINRQKVYQFI